MRKMTATYPARRLAPVALAALAALVAGCGSKDDPEPRAGGALVVYSSLPREGISARQAAAVAAGQRLALADAKGRAGGRAVRLIELDSSGGEDAPWDPDAIEANAKRAEDDDAAVAYLGELDLGGSAVSVPVTNAAGLLQVSPGDGLPSLTQTDPGGGGEGPVRYYPEGRRTFIRLVPHAGLQARALVDWARQRGARSVVIVRDESVFGRELASWSLELAERARLPARVERMPGDDFDELARDVAERRPGGVLLTAQAGEDADLAAAALRRALPPVPVLGTSALAADPPPGVDYLDPHLPAREYGAAARRVLRRLERTSGARPGVESLYGYESMRLVLAAVERSRARPGEREAVLRAAVGPRRVDEVLPPYFISPGGDVATSVFGAYRATATGARPIGVREGAP
jgi:ABC-type branched-subunit amino acid transport system substrate-binding protein